MTITATTGDELATTSRPNATAARWLRIDALLSGASGFLLAVLTPLLDDLLGAPAALLVALGLFLVGYAAVLVLVARRGGAPRRAVAAVVAGNAIWVVASVVVALADLLTLTAAGTVLVLFQAGAVAVVAERQLRSIGTASSSSAGPRARRGRGFRR